MPADLLTLANSVNFLAATAGVAAASYGLVDVSKLLWGGISNAGFGHIKRALSPFEASFSDAGNKSLLKVVRANWLNGVPLSEQKNIAKSLIKVGLSPKSAFKLADAVGLDPPLLRAAVDKVAANNSLDPSDTNTLSRFDALVSAAVDAGFDRADQKYRNSAKGLSSIIAIGLAVIGGAVVHAQGGEIQWGNYFGSQDFLASLLLGATASALAPVAKDLSSRLSRSVRWTAS
jgi:hypothetical protein